MYSIWEKETFGQCDDLIIGAGITGLSTAISILTRAPKRRVLVLERGILPTGASTKNAGFACFGSLTEILSDLSTMSEAELVELVKMRRDGLDILRQRLGDKAIDYQGLGGYELIRENETWALVHLDRVNQLLYPVFHQPVFELRNELLPVFGFGKSIEALVINQFEGQLHTGKMVKGLLNLAQSLGASVLTGAEVLQVGDSEVTVKGPVSQADFQMGFAKLFVCTNAFTDQLLQAESYEPGRGMVIATKPIPNLPFEGAFHVDQGYYYFRNHGQRIILGGGRNLDFAGERTKEMGINERIRRRLLQLLRDDILPNHHAEVEHTWSGIMAFGKQKKPVIQQVRDNVFAGYRLGGMGVAIGSKVGEELAKLAYGS